MEMLGTVITLLVKVLNRAIIRPLKHLVCHLNRPILIALAAVGIHRLPPREELGEEEDETDDAGRSINESNYVLIMEGAVPSLVHMNILKRRMKQRIPVVVAVRRCGAAEGEDETVCSVCLNGLEEGEEVKELSNCKHVFHRKCIDCWMDGGHFTCPFCRALIFCNEMAQNVDSIK